MEVNKWELVRQLISFGHHLEAVVLCCGAVMRRHRLFSFHLFRRTVELTAP